MPIFTCPDSFGSIREQWSDAARTSALNQRRLNRREKRKKTQSWRHDPKTPLPEHLYRGTEKGSYEQTARYFKGGELGGGVYHTPEEGIAATYGGGSTASTAAGSRVVHKVAWARKPTPREIAYAENTREPSAYGAAKFDAGRSRIVTGAGKVIWRGEAWGSNYMSDRPDMLAAAQKAGVKVLVGLSTHVGTNQISILDQSIVKVVSPKGVSPLSTKKLSLAANFALASGKVLRGKGLKARKEQAKATYFFSGGTRDLLKKKSYKKLRTREANSSSTFYAEILKLPPRVKRKKKRVLVQ